MKKQHHDGRLRLLTGMVVLALGSSAYASTLNQNVSWTVDRSGTTAKYRVVA